MKEKSRKPVSSRLQSAARRVNQYLRRKKEGRLPMGFNRFRGHNVMAYDTKFETPGQRAARLLHMYGADVSKFLDCKLSDIELVQWGDEAGPINNFVAASKGAGHLRKMKSFEKDLVKNIKIVDAFPSQPSSCVINNQSGGGIKIHYDRCAIDQVIGIELGGFKAAKVTVVCAPGPASDWTETIIYLAMAKQDVDKVVSFISKLQDEHKQAPVFHTISSNGNSEDVDIDPFSWDNIILDPEVIKLLRSDFDSFFTREEWFKKKKLPFRRGYLLHGEPGNGKTSAIKAMMWAKSMDAYTLSFFDKNVGLSELNTVFESAAENRPSMVVLEDIDRAFPKSGSKCAISLQELLNAIDGIGTKEGIITIATANNPADLDPAILKRPGRFDRTVKFDHPSEELRRKYYLSKDPDINQDDDFVAAVKESSGYSFAQLQESYILAAQFAYDENLVEITGAYLVKAVRMLSGSNKGVKKQNTVGFS